jgi:hypothetical protein
MASPVRKIAPQQKAKCQSQPLDESRSCDTDHTAPLFAMMNPTNCYCTVLNLLLDLLTAQSHQFQQAQPQWLQEQLPVQRFQDFVAVHGMT